MNRNEALNFIKENSRMVMRLPINKKEDWYRSEPFKQYYLEQRIGNNGNLFILDDMGVDGWYMYFISGNNNVNETMQQFSEKMNTPLPEFLIK